MEYETKTLILKCILLSTQKVMDAGKVVIEDKIINEIMSFFHVDFNMAKKCIKELSQTGLIKRDEGFIYLPRYEVIKDIRDLVV